MHPKLAAPYKTLLVAQRTSLLEQRANLRGGAVGRAEASAEHFGQKEDSSAQLNTERELEFAMDARGGLNGATALGVNRDKRW